MTQDSSKTVYIVDDEHVIADTLAIIIRNAGFSAYAFYSAEQALIAIASKPPNLLISDVVMTGMTGIDLMLHLRNFHPDVRCVLFSGQAQTPFLLQEVRRRGHEITVLAKPMHPEQLLSHVRSSLS